jgi:hypothetical protein
MAKDEIRSQEWVDNIEQLVRRAESISDPEARTAAMDLLEAVLDFHAAALERVLEIVAQGDTATGTMERIARDDLASSMLLLHNLHPDDLRTRIERALEKLQQMFASLGAQLSLVAIENETVRLRFDSPRAWAATPVKISIEKAVFQAAPEIGAVIIEGLKEASPVGFVPVSDLLAGSPA